MIPTQEVIDNLTAQEIIDMPEEVIELVNDVRIKEIQEGLR